MAGNAGFLWGGTSSSTCVRYTGANILVTDRDDAYTIMCWVRRPSGVGSNFMALRAAWNNGETLAISTGGALTLAVGDGTTQYTTSAGSMTDDVWHHVAIVRSSATSCIAYLDGVASSEITNDISSRAASTPVLWFGVENQFVTTTAQGELADCKVFDEALTEEEIEAEATAGVPIKSGAVTFTPARQYSPRSGGLPVDMIGGATSSGLAAFATEATAGLPPYWLFPARDIGALQAVEEESGGSGEINTTGIASGEAFGSATVTADREITTTGIPTEEAFGSATVTTAQEIATTGIESGEAFGNATITVDQEIATTGIESGETFGSATVTADREIETTGIASGEAFGSATVTADGEITTTGIPSGETFGDLTVTADGEIVTTGIATGEAFGSATVTVEQEIQTTGIATGEAFGSATVTTEQEITTTGIPTGETFGEPTITTEQEIETTGIASGEAFGEPQVVSTGTQQIDLSGQGIASGEVFGSTVLNGGVRAIRSGLVVTRARSMSTRGRRQTVETRLPELPKNARTGDLMFFNGTQWVFLPADAADGSVLTLVGGRPQWS